MTTVKRKRFIRFTICLAVALATTWVQAETIVRVQPTPGGPQIMVDGKPVPPRMFFGSRRGGHCQATEQWTEKRMEFTPVQPIRKRGTLHFRFESEPAEYWIKDLRIIDTATGKDVLRPGTFAEEEAFGEVWNTWPPGELDTVGRVAVEDGALRVTLTAPGDGKWPDFHLYTDLLLSFEKDHTYRCSFQVRSSRPARIRPAVYNKADGGVYDRIGEPPGVFLEQVELARDAGIRFVSTSMPACWTEPGRPIDWSPLDRVCRQIIDTHPKVLLLPRVSANVPNWWMEKHPDAWMKYEGDEPGRYATVSSRRYRKDVSEHLEKLCRHLNEAFPDHFAGIHPCGQNTGEWFYDGTWREPLSGYDPATEKAWREWLAARGESGATAVVPSPEARHAAPFGLLRDPVRERELIQFNRFWQVEMADMVNAMAAACRRGTDGKKLVVFFYGYLFEFGPIRNGAPLCGHYALSKVLPSPDIDILCSPISYFDRQWQGTGASMTAAETVTAAGKLWLNEDDTRTYLAATGRYGGVADLPQTRAVMMRNTAQAALRGFGTWWMDLPGLGWFNDKRIWDEHERLRPVDEAMLSRARPFTPEIAAIIGEESMVHLAGGADLVGRPLVYECRSVLGRVGAPYGQYMLEDAIAGKVPAKLQVYVAAWAMTPDQRKQLAANRRPGTTRVWCYAPGYLLPERADAAAMSEVTGFRHRPLDLADATATPTEVGRRLGLTQPWGPEGEIAPLFAVESEPGDEVLATYGDGSASVVLRRGSGGVDVFLGTPRLTPELARALARVAGAHLYAETDAGIWAAEDYLSIHAMSDGPLAIDTGCAAPAVDAFTGERLGLGPRFSLPIRAGETRVLKIR